MLYIIYTRVTYVIIIRLYCTYTDAPAITTAKRTYFFFLYTFFIRRTLLSTLNVYYCFLPWRSRRSYFIMTALGRHRRWSVVERVVRELTHAPHTHTQVRSRVKTNDRVGSGGGGGGIDKTTVHKTRLIPGTHLNIYNKLMYVCYIPDVPLAPPSRTLPPDDPSPPRRPSRRRSYYIHISNRRTVSRFFLTPRPPAAALPRIL